MPLENGTRIGPYEITGLLGAGGMGEVYRARDSALNRDVAIKVLSDPFAADPDRVTRFQREAEALAALNHPNIAQIYGWEQAVGAGHPGARALVMELVDGEDLSQVIERTAKARELAPHTGAIVSERRQAAGVGARGMSIEDGLDVARQIAEALEAAHDRGIIHRDLKPANVKVRADGTVKVLDFGLAKALDPAAGAGLQASDTALNSPTLTNRATQVGVILGTAAYMAPEQARGRPVDKRADLWAFGCVLYEMLTGCRAFPGEDVTDTLAAVVRADPDWAALPATVPPRVREVLRACLEKDPKHRVRDIRDVRLALEKVPDVAGVPAAGPPVASRAGWRSRLPWVAAGLVVGALAVGLLTWTTLRPRGVSAAAPLRRFALTLPDPLQLRRGVGGLIAISPDGQTLVYRAEVAGVFHLYRQSLDEIEATPIPGTERATQTFFFSPNGRWIAFEVADTLMKVELGTGHPKMICRLKPRGVRRGGSWGDDDMLILSAASAGLERVAASGGDPELVVESSLGRGYWYPQILPDGHSVIFTVSADEPQVPEVVLFDLKTRKRQTLVAGTGGRFVASGHLVFVRGGTLWAAGFDLRRLEVSTAPVPVEPGIRVEAAGAIQVAVADDGSLAYIPGTVGNLTLNTLVWVDREGRETALPTVPARVYHAARLSPDDTRVVVSIRDQENDIWVWNFAADVLTRITFDPGLNANPVWSRDGEWIAYGLRRDDGYQVLRQRASGLGRPEALTGVSSRFVAPQTYAKDGALLMAELSEPQGITLLNAPGGTARDLLRTPTREYSAEVSPDGRWLAYESETGIWVRPFPDVDAGAWQVSTDGGSRPLWSRSGDELFYVVASSGTLMTVPVEPGTTFVHRAARPLFPGYRSPFAESPRYYDVAKDGRFLFIKQATSSEPTRDTARVTIVQNWVRALERPGAR